METLKKILLIWAVVLLLLPWGVYSRADTTWTVYPEKRYEIDLLGIPGYETLKSDFHIHSVFSDGLVWPTVRVEEAWREGLHAISLTDHVEYQPHKEDISTNRNRSYHIAFPQAARRNILVAMGAEITRDTPPGHFNAIFLTDVNALNTEDVLDAVGAANEQGAFVFWNHPGWKGPDRGRWGDVQATLYERGWLHGIEICTGEDYYPEAHRWAVEKNLTLIGNSDIHAPAAEAWATDGDHRTMTLVFAQEQSIAALKSALFAGHTVVWFKDQLIGRKEYLEDIIYAAVEISPPHHSEKNAYWISVTNKSGIDLRLERSGSDGPPQLRLPASATVQLRVQTDREMEQVRLSYVVKNFLVAPEECLQVSWVIPLSRSPQESLSR